jgi:hypothetical protein
LFAAGSFKTLSAWNELLDEFRALGGTADNIRLGHGEFGRGIFPMDPTKPVAIHIPDNLLVSPNDMVFTNGMLRVGSSSIAGERERAWLNRYQEEFGWSGGGADEVRRTFEMAGALPAELRHALFAKYQCGLWFEEPTDMSIQNGFFNARALTHRDEAVVIPIIELVNHGSGSNYNTSNGVALRGTFPGEVFVQYSHMDSYDFFRSWGFATQRPSAFSVALTGNIESARLEIEALFRGINSSERDWIPKIEKKADCIELQFLMIGNQRYPRLPKGIFYRLMRDAGYSEFEESFDLIHHVNRLHFIDLLAILDGIELPMARTLRAMAQYQLRAMSYCFGVREI